MANQISLRIEKVVNKNSCIITNYAIVRDVDQEEVGHISTIKVWEQDTLELTSTIHSLEENDHYSCSGLLRILQDENPTFLTARGLTFIDEMFVVDTYRNSGVGALALSLLLTSNSKQGQTVALEACPGIDGTPYELISDTSKRAITTIEDTLRLKSWYTKFGFKDLGTQDYMILQAP